MVKTVVYHGDNFLGEVEIYCNEVMKLMMMMKGVIRISHYSKPSERCPPLAVLHTITSSSGGIWFKMESSSSSSCSSSSNQQELEVLHSTCLRDHKTAVIPLFDQEIHLVAMRSRRVNGTSPCFWGFSVGLGLYDSCLSMLNLRCLSIVFDLDETLVVANTMRSFEDRIEALQRRISVETDPQRLAGMMAEVKRYHDDRAMLKQYAETDQVVDDGKVYKVEAEVIPALSDNHQTVVRPLIRLQDKNIVLTRINPQIRDTSVFVRLRPAWEDLRNYLTAKGRKRFEVYVCTMAERDYALEMWRLLDPDSNLISTEELLDRVVCVKSGVKKSLFNVFQRGVCHPKMALVIDDRLKVWDEKDQPRVHVVPAFAPYYAPQAEANNAIPVLCLARNVACNVRGGFFREFDETLLQRIPEVLYDNDIRDIPSPPDVSNYLVHEDDGCGSNPSKEPPCFDGMAGAEVERRLKEALFTAAPALSQPSTTMDRPLVNVASPDPRIPSPLPFTVASPAPPIVTVPKPAAIQASIPPYHSNTFSQEEGELLPEPELDPDVRRRLLILQHGQDMRENIPNQPSFPVMPVPGSKIIEVDNNVREDRALLNIVGPGFGPLHVSGPIPMPVPGPRGSWFPMEPHMSSGHSSGVGFQELPRELEPVNVERQCPPPPFLPHMEHAVHSGGSFFERKRPASEALYRDDSLRSSHASPINHGFQGDDFKLGQATSDMNLEVKPERGISFSESPVGALRDIARRCGTKVDFRGALVADVTLKFSMEVYFAGEMVGEGIGLTRKEAQEQAAEAALMNLADKYLAHKKLQNGTQQSISNRGYESLDRTNSYSDRHSVERSSNQVRLDDFDVDGSRNSMGSISALKELVAIDGQTLGKGTRLTWDEAKAAEKTFVSLKSMVGQFSPKHQGSPRSVQGISSKRLRSEYSWR